MDSTTTAPVSPTSPSQSAPATGCRVDRAHEVDGEVATAAGRGAARLTGVQILACGSYAPPQVVTNADLAVHGYDADWIVQRTGIRERRWAEPCVAASDLAYEASIRCLQVANVPASDVDLIVLATTTSDSPMPSTACQLQRRLGCRAAAMDIGAA